MGLIDEISIKRIHIEETFWGHFLAFYLFGEGVNDLSHLVVLSIFETISVLRTVDASCRLLLLFLSGSWQEVWFGELFDSLSCTALDMPAPDWAQKMLCIIVPNRRTVSPEFFLWVCTRRLLPGSFTKLVRARETFIFYFPNQKRRNYRWVEKTFGMLSAGAIQFAPRIFCFWLITMYRK